MKTVTVITPEKEIKLTASEGSVLADVLADNGFAVPAVCGRKGTCGKCAVQLADGRFLNEIPDANGMIRSCKAILCEDAVIKLNFECGSGLTDFTQKEGNKKNVCGIAVDIGTTTVAAAFLKKDGSTVTASCLNPQSAYGADVISRIEACAGGALSEQTRLIRDCINRLIAELDPDGEAEEAVISGNTTMLHIFCGVSPESMGVYPFTPQFTDAVYISGTEIGIKTAKVTVLPSFSAFIGGDIVSGVYALGLHKTDSRVLFADLGTNGELVFSDRGRLYCTSTAAGPALEGACIECGVGGITGAVDKVFTEDGEIGYTTVGGAKPVGICGAGIVDAISVMLEENLIEESGYLEDGKFDICKNVYISQKDVRQYQLAKSAVFSGIETLSDFVGVSENSIDSLCVAGGLGYYLNTQSAVKTGLLPRLPKDKFKAVGNTSLQGALMCIGNPEAVSEMQELAKKMTSVDLGGNPKFNERFMNNMFFN